MVVSDREQMIDGGETRGRLVADGLDLLLVRSRGARDAAAAEPGGGRAVRLPLVEAIGLVVHAAHVDQLLELQLGRAAQRAANFEQPVAPDAVSQVAPASLQPP